MLWQDNGDPGGKVPQAQTSGDSPMSSRIGSQETAAIPAGLEPSRPVAPLFARYQAVRKMTESLARAVEPGGLPDPVDARCQPGEVASRAYDLVF